MYVWKHSTIWLLNLDNIYRKKKIGTFKMLGYRKILNIRWTEIITNNKVLEWILDGRLLWTSITKKRNEWIGHILKHEGLLKLVIEGRWEKLQRKTKIGTYTANNEGLRIWLVRNEKKIGKWKRMENSCKLIYWLKLFREKGWY